jgi:putative oxidoreductase
MPRALTTVARLLLGADLLFAGMLPWTHLMQLPIPNPAAGAILIALDNTGIVMQLVKVLETLAGLLLLFNRFVPLALIILAPIVTFIAIIDYYLDANRMAVVACSILVVPLVWLFFAYRDYYRPLLVYKSEPATSNNGCGRAGQLPKMSSAQRS